jgi:hypothetical protein
MRMGITTVLAGAASVLCAYTAPDALAQQQQQFNDKPLQENW